MNPIKKYKGVNIWLSGNIYWAIVGYKQLQDTNLPNLKYSIKETLEEAKQFSL